MVRICSRTVAHVSQLVVLIDAGSSRRKRRDCAETIDIRG